MKIGFMIFVLVGAASAHVYGQTWTNAENPLDVNADSNVWFDDALAILNRVHSESAGQLPATGNPPPYYDVSQDDFLSPLDFLILANTFNLSDDPTPPNGLVPATAGEGRIRLATVDGDGNSVESVNIGDSFTLQVHVSDTDPAGLGVYGTYFDMSFANAMVEPLPSTELFDERFSFGRSGIANGQFNAVGATYADIELPDAGESMLYSIDFRAIGFGEIEFSIGDDATMLLFGTDNIVPAVSYDAVAVAIVPEPVATAWSFLLPGLFVRWAKKRKNQRG